MNKKEIRERAQQVQDYMVQMRRTFHENPEVSGKEWKTRERLIPTGIT